MSYDTLRHFAMGMVCCFAVLIVLIAMFTEPRGKA